MYFLRSSQRKNPRTPSYALAVPFDDEALFVVGHVRPLDLEGHLRLFRRALQLRELRAIVRLRPRLDGAFLDRLGGIRHHQIHVQLDDVAEAVARRARAERVVEGEQPRLRILVRDPALPALEAFRKEMNTGRSKLRPYGRWRWGRARSALLHGPGRTPALEIRHLDRIGQPLPQIVGADLHAIDDHLQHGAIAQRRGIRIFDPHGGPVDEQPGEALSAQAGDCRGHGLPPGLAWFPLGLHLPADFLLRLFRQLVDLDRVPAGDRRVQHRQIESNQQAGPRRQLAELARDDLGRLAHDLAAAAAAVRAPHARVQQPHVVVNLRRRADGRSRITDAVFLADGDRRRDAVDAIDVGLLHPLEELAGVGGERFDVPPLALRVNRVEGERRLPRAADAGHDDQLPERQGQVDILEIMRARAAHDEIGGFGGPGNNGVGHCSVFDPTVAIL